MGHEIDLKNYNLRTDLIIENDLENIKSKTTIVNDIKITSTIILDKNNILNKEKGKYVTIEFKDVTDSSNYQNVLNIFENELKKFLNFNKNDLGLIIGLGNKNSTPDSIGPEVIKNIITTNHIYMYDMLDENYQRIAAFAPGVTGETGIETSEYIKGIIDKINPKFLIVIDALASRSVERLNKTIQMTDTGIKPGSGVGNNRLEISEKNLGIPVIAIGIPTVVDAVSIVADTLNFMNKHYSFSKQFIKKPISKLVDIKNINYLKQEYDTNPIDKERLLGFVGTLNDDEIRSLILEVLSPIDYNLMVTPKEIDFLILKLSNLISEGINNLIKKS